MYSYCLPAYFALFLPAVVLAYSIIPQRFRWAVLLGASYAFFWAISGKLLVFLLIATAIIYLAGLALGAMQEKRSAAVKAAERAERKAIKALYQTKQRRVLTLAVLALLGMLLVLKYAGFFGKNVNALLGLLNLPQNFPVLKFALPIGISFYTLQAVSYLIDVYRGTVAPDRNPARLALYMSFFPGLMEGPICRYSDTAAQLWEGRPITWHNLTFGIQRILFGLAKKMVIADRLNPMIVEVFDNYGSHTGGGILLGILGYTCQLYMEFSGTIDVVIGSAEIFGITLPENFRHPFFSKSISEFWTRWHITLGTWFKDYIFYPVSLSGPLKKLTSNARKKLGNHFGPLCASAIALFCVWFSNGLWHGAAWTYIFFGLYHFFFILCGNLFDPLTKWTTGKLHINRQSKPWHAWQIFRTFVLVNIGEMIFRANSLTDAFRMFRRMIGHFTLETYFDGNIFTMGLSRSDAAIVAVAVVLVLIVSILQERGVRIRETVAGWALPARWACYLALILFLIIFGAYGPAYSPVDPIYAGF